MSVIGHGPSNLEWDSGLDTGTDEWEGKGVLRPVAPTVHPCVFRPPDPALTGVLNPRPSVSAGPDQGAGRGGGGRGEECQDPGGGLTP